MPLDWNSDELLGLRVTLAIFVYSITILGGHPNKILFMWLTGWQNPTCWTCSEHLIITPTILMNMVKELYTTCSMFWHSPSIATSISPNFKMLLKGLRMFSHLVMAFCGAIWSAFKGGKAIQHGYECPGWSEFSLLWHEVILEECKRFIVAQKWIPLLNPVQHCSSMQTLLLMQQIYYPVFVQLFISIIGCATKKGNL